MTTTRKATKRMPIGGAETAMLDTAGADALVEVRALRDDGGLGLRPGRLARVPRDMLPGLVAAAAVDDHPDAVAYARTLEGGAA